MALDDQIKALATETGAQLKALRDSIGTPAADTGFVDMTAYLAAGVSGTFYARRVGDLVELVGYGILASFASATPLDFTTALPTQYRPSLTRTGGAYFASTFTAGTVAMRATGVGFLLQASGTTKTTANFSMTYFV